MEAVPAALLLAEPLRELRGKAVSLPVRVAAGQRDDVVVAELLERLRRERGAAAGRAIEHDPGAPIGDGVLDPRLEVAARDVNRSGNVSFVPLVALAHVDEDGVFALDQRGSRRGVDLLDLGLDLVQ